MKVSRMGSVRYKEIKVTLSAATFSRLEQANPFNRGRAADQAIEVIRAALYTMYPPRTPDEWRDARKFQGIGRHILIFCYDVVCYLLRKLMGRDDDRGRYPNEVAQPFVALTLKIPIGLVHCIEKVAQDQASTIPEATVYAIEYGHRVLDSQDPLDGRKIWRDIRCAIWKRLVNVDRV